MYELREIAFNGRDEWDFAIAHFDRRHFYHMGAWLDFVERTQVVRRRVYEIYDGNVIVGYLPGFIVKKGLITVFGSPLPGWTTPYMGPVVNHDINMDALLRSIAIKLKQDHIHYAELCPNGLDCTPAIPAGFRLMRRSTYIAPIQRDSGEMLSSFSKSTRQAVRHAMRSNLRVMTSTDPSFIDHYYSQLQEVFAKSRMLPTYSKERLHVLWELLMPTGRMLNTIVVKGERCIGTRIDFVGDDCLHSFGSASSQAFLKDYPNEIARYHAMCEALKRGLAEYDMSGGGTYKAKFNARQVEVPVLLWGTNALMMARDVVRKFHNWKLRAAYAFSRSYGLAKERQ